MSISAKAFEDLPFPGGWLASELHTFTKVPRLVRGPFLEHHWAKGAGIWEAFCGRSRVESFRRDGWARRAETCALHLAGTLAQAAVWLPTGVAAGIAAGLIYAMHGREATRLQLAEYYLPVMMTIMVGTVAIYITCMAGGALLLTGRLR